MDIDYGPRVSIESRHGTLQLHRVQIDRSELILILSVEWYPDRGAGGVIPVRIQSSCVFSEAFGAIDCDCADQLNEALRTTVEENGITVYAFEEGRGAGLSSKFAAINLQQEKSINTRDAFQRLGLPSDPRTFYAPAVLVADMVGNAEIELLTNNPKKVEGLSSVGLNVVGARPLIVVRSEESRTYLLNKADVLGHSINIERAPSGEGDSEVDQ